MLFLGNAAWNLLRWRREANLNLWHPLWGTSPRTLGYGKGASTLSLPQNAHRCHRLTFWSARVLQKCLLQGQRTPAEARKLLSDSRQLAEVHSLQTWEARTEKKHAFPDPYKPCPGVFWPVTLGPNCSYISPVEHIFIASLCCSGKSKPSEGGLAREWLLHSQGREAKASAIAWDRRQ